LITAVIIATFISSAGYPQLQSAAISAPHQLAAASHPQHRSEELHQQPDAEALSLR